MTYFTIVEFIGDHDGDTVVLNNHQTKQHFNVLRLLLLCERSYLLKNMQTAHTIPPRPAANISAPTMI